MKILDRYILRKFLTTFFFVVLLLVAILLVVDLAERMDDIIRMEIGIGQILVGYYLNFIPYMLNLLSPITVFIATVFVTANMAARTEIVAILSSGVSFVRMLKPFVIGALILGLFTFYLIGWVIPVGNRDRIDFENQFFKDNRAKEGRNIHLKIAPETYLYMESYNPAIMVGYQATIETFKEGKLVSKLKCSRLKWRHEKEHWQMDRCWVRTIDGDKEQLFQLHSKDTILPINPKDLETAELLYEMFTLPELNQFIRRMESRGAENLEVYQSERAFRYAYPFSIVILTIIGVILSSKKSREGIGLQIALGFILAFVYIIFSITSRSLANVGDMHPIFAAQLPNILFAILGIYLYTKVPK
jgi:lipopolysaccharide export system permease protein